jgi:hypothetical protein
MKVKKILTVLLVNFLFVWGSFSTSFANSEAPLQEKPKEAKSKDTSLEEFKKLQMEVYKLKKSYKKLNKRMKKKARTDYDIPKLQLRGFGSMQFDLKDTQTATTGDTTNGFSVGFLDLYITSQISKKMSFINETLWQFTGGGQSQLSVKRVLLKYEFEDWFALSAGRGHTALGYWNERYFHAIWLLTTVDRPLIFKFGGNGGVLPLHYLGLEASGDIQTSFGQFHYLFDVSNGRGKTPGDVQELGDANDSKMYAFQFTFEPSAIDGFGFGANVLTDTIPTNLAAGRAQEIDETIAGAHLFYTADPFEFVTEWQVINHNGITTQTHNGGYVQFGFQLGDFVSFVDNIMPYYRYDWLRLDASDPFYATLSGIQDTDQHILGARYDIVPYAALKVEYSNLKRGVTKINSLVAQLSFAF